MDYTLIINTPSTGRNAVACATKTDVQNMITDFIRHTDEQSYIIEVVFNV